MTSPPDRHISRAARRGVFGVLAGFVALTSVSLVACGNDKSSDGGSSSGTSETQLEGLVRTPPTKVGAVTLPEVADGKPDVPFPFKAKDGQLLFVTFGYTNCPDVCPTTLSDLKKAKAKADPDDKVAAAFVTVDPERDTADIIGPYLGSFVKDGHPIRTMVTADLDKAKDAFGVKSSVTKTEDGTIEVTHSARSFVIDDQGKVVVEWAFGTGSDSMAHDLEILIAQT